MNIKGIVLVNIMNDYLLLSGFCVNYFTWKITAFFKISVAFVPYYKLSLLCYIQVNSVCDNSEGAFLVLIVL